MLAARAALAAGLRHRGLRPRASRRVRPQASVPAERSGSSCDRPFPIDPVSGRVHRRRRETTPGRGRLDAHRSHPGSLRRRLGVGPGEVRAGWEILDVIVHITARGQRHPCVFHLAADRRQDRARSPRPTKAPRAASWTLAAISSGAKPSLPPSLASPAVPLTLISRGNQTAVGSPFLVPPARACWPVSRMTGTVPTGLAEALPPRSGRDQSTIGRGRRVIYSLKESAGSTVLDQ